MAAREFALLSLVNAGTSPATGTGIPHTGPTIRNEFNAFHAPSFSRPGFGRSILQPLQPGLQLRQVGRSKPTDVGVLKRSLTRPRHDRRDLSLRHTREPSCEGQDLVPQLGELRNRNVTVPTRAPSPRSLSAWLRLSRGASRTCTGAVRRAPVRFRRVTVPRFVGTVAIPWYSTIRIGMTIRGLGNTGHDLSAARHCSRQPGGLHLEVGVWRELCQKWRISTKFGASFTR